MSHILRWPDLILLVAIVFIYLSVRPIFNWWPSNRWPNAPRKKPNFIEWPEYERKGSFDTAIDKLYVLLASRENLGLPVKRCTVFPPHNERRKEVIEALHRIAIFDRRSPSAITEATLTILEAVPQSRN